MGVLPPWYHDDYDAFNCYAMSETAKRNIYQLGLAIRGAANNHQEEVQEALCHTYCGCSMDDLTDDEFNYLQDVVMYRT
jgi:hypothetical protein